MSAIEIIRLLDAAIALAVSAGVNVDKLRAMQAQNANGSLTPEQVRELADAARSAVGRL